MADVGVRAVDNVSSKDCFAASLNFEPKVRLVIRFDRIDNCMVFDADFLWIFCKKASENPGDELVGPQSASWAYNDAICTGKFEVLFNEIFSSANLDSGPNLNEPLGLILSHMQSTQPILQASLP